MNRSETIRERYSEHDELNEKYVPGVYPSAEDAADGLARMLLAHLERDKKLDENFKVHVEPQSFYSALANESASGKFYHKFTQTLQHRSYDLVQRDYGEAKVTLVAESPCPSFLSTTKVLLMVKVGGTSYVTQKVSASHSRTTTTPRGTGTGKTSSSNTATPTRKTKRRVSKEWSSNSRTLFAPRFAKWI